MTDSEKFEKRQEKRQEILRACQRALSTPDGEILMKELSDAWDAAIPVVSDIQLAAGVSQRNCFKLLEQLQNGDYVNA